MFLCGVVDERFSHAVRCRRGGGGHGADVFFLVTSSSAVVVTVSLLSLAYTGKDG